MNKTLNIREVDNGFIVNMTVEKPAKESKGKAPISLGDGYRIETRELICPNNAKLFKIVKEFFGTNIELKEDNEEDDE